METRECDYKAKRTLADGSVVFYTYKKKYNATTKHCGKSRAIKKIRGCNDEQKMKLINDYIDSILGE